MVDLTDDTHDGPAARGDDCGSFILDALGPYNANQLKVLWSDNPRPTNDQIEQLIESVWHSRRTRAKAEGTMLWDGPLCRLIDWRSEPDELTMTLGPTCFRDFLGTNLCNAHLRYSHGPEMLANAVGVSAVVITTDSQLILGRRSQAVAFHAGLIHPMGGCVTPGDNGQSPDPFGAMSGEIHEELGLPADRHTAITCLGMIRDKKIIQPEMVFDVHVKAAADDVHSAMANAEDAAEHAQLVQLGDSRDEVVAFMDAHGEELTPVAQASLLLHGLRCWGSGWFTSTRGYLRSLI